MDLSNQMTLPKIDGLTSFDRVGEIIFAVVAVGLMLLLESQRQGNVFAGGASVSITPRQLRFRADSIHQFAKRFRVEFMCLALCAAFAILLRLFGDSGAPSNDPAWTAITREWPLLMTADSLLSLQSMLRLAMLISLTCRARAKHTTADASPLSAETSVFLLLAGFCRVSLLAKSRVYMLDGPLGGWRPAGCDVLSTLLLLPLGLHAVRTTHRLILVLLVSSVCIWVASGNRLFLAEDHVTDTLFTSSHTLEIVAAGAHLLHTMFRSTGDWFVHLVLSLQQGFAAYYFLTAFEATPELVGAGNPFMLLQIGGAAQLGMFLGASALYISEMVEGPDRASL